MSKKKMHHVQMQEAALIAGHEAVRATGEEQDAAREEEAALTSAHEGQAQMIGNAVLEPTTRGAQERQDKERTQRR